MSIQSMNMQNIYLRMGEVSREQDKKIKKEEREQSLQKQIQKSREEDSDHTVNKIRESHADQTVKEHEDHGLPSQKKRLHQGGNDSVSPLPPLKQMSAQDIALPMATLVEHAAVNHQQLPISGRDLFDPDLGNHINIES